MAGHIRVVVADDHLLMRRGLRMTLEEVDTDFALVGEAGDGATALRVVAEMQPDVVLMDVRMPGIDGLEALARIKATWPHIAVVILTTYNDDHLIVQAIRAGACGYLLKDCDLETLLATLRSAARGDTLLQPELMARLAQALQPAQTQHRSMPRPFELTEREQAILAAVARGERSKEIAQRLGLTRRTVETYLSTIYNKLGVDSRAAAVALVLEQHLLPKKS